MKEHVRAGCLIAGIAATGYLSFGSFGQQEPKEQAPYLDINRANFFPPPSVLGATGAVVELYSAKSTGSGAIVAYDNQPWIVSAAHVVVGSDEYCLDEGIDYPASHPAPAYEGKVTGQSKIWEYSTLDDYDYTTFNRGVDAALIQPAGKFILERHQHLKIQEEVKLKLGEIVFSLGFGPRAIGKDQVFDPSPLKQDSQLNEPVIVPQIFLERNNNKLTLLSGVAWGPGPIKDNFIRRGDSGGPLLNAQGQYLGEVIASEEMLGTAIENTFDLDLPPEIEHQQLSLAYAEVIDTGVLNQLRRSVVRCKSLLAK